MSYLEFFQDGKRITTLEFPETEIGSSSNVKLVIKNPNHWPIMIVDSLIVDDDIKISKLPDVIDALDSITADVTLTPTPGRGPVNAELNAKVMF